MRWYWIDRFTEFVSGTRASALKVVNLGAEQTEEHLPGYPVMPNSLIIEGIAQTGGLLAGEYFGFQARIVLAKVGHARFHCDALPGDTLKYSVTMQHINQEMATIVATSHIGDRLQGEVELLFANLTERIGPPELFVPAEFLRMLRVLEMYTVGKKADGTPIEVPPKLAEAEKIEMEFVHRWHRS